MIERIGAYRLALWLAFAVALTHLVFSLHLLSRGFADGGKIATYYGVPALVVVFGLWVASNLARYVGAVFFLGCFGAMIWPLFKPGFTSVNFAVVWLIAAAALSLAEAWLLLLSKQFADEFAHRRLTLAPHRRTLRTIAIAAIVTAVVVASAVDIYRVLSAQW